MTIPLSSHEVRWFLDGGLEQHARLRRWFQTVGPREKRGDVRQPRFADATPRTDVYLLLPGAEDMGIKWREGEFQIKGRMSSAGIHVFGGQHQGAVERWMKWSYAGVPSAYQRLFEPDDHRGLVTIAVVKRRVLRKVRLDPVTGAAEEVAAGASIDRGVAIELTDLDANGRKYCSLAFEAFPDDPAMEAAFTAAVERFLGPLNELALTARQSASYPSWLMRLNA